MKPPTPQHRLDDAVRSIIKEAMAARAFPGVVLWLSRGGEMLLHEAHGATSYAGGNVTTATVYDIASLTKLFTMSAFLIAMDEASVQVEAPMWKFLPEFAATDKAAITLLQLLHHSSGIACPIQSLTDLPVEQWGELVASAPLRSAPGIKVLYSCTNFFLLGRIIERISGCRLDHYIAARLLEPLGMTSTTFTPLECFDRALIAPTEVDPAGGAPWHGVVHDEAARAFVAANGGCCGNAGLFSTAADLARFAALWAGGGSFADHGIIPAALARRAMTDTVPAGSHRRGWCWQVDAAFFMSEHAPAGTVGHTGFTGPTLLLNAASREVAIILENRVHPTRHGPDRMPYHRRVADAFFSSE